MNEKYIRIPEDAPNLASAKETVRTILCEINKPSSVTVVVPAGKYSPKDFVFTEADCSADVKVIYKAKPGAMINGGLAIPPSEWKTPDAEMLSRFSKEAAEHIRMIDLTEYGLCADDWGEMCPIGTYQQSALYDDTPKGCNVEVFTGGRRMTIARYPNEGYTKLAGVVDPGACIAKAGERNPNPGAYTVGDDMANRIANWKEPTNDVWLFGYLSSDWADTSSPITDFDPATRTIKPKYYSRWGVRDNALYYLFNIPEELDVPGEWYLDRKNGHLYFYPWNEKENLDFSYSDTPLICCTDTKNMTFDGFTLTSTMGDAVSCKGDDMTFTNIFVSNVYGNAVKCTGYRCTVSDSEICHTGRGGIVFDGGDRETLTPSHNRATNNYIHDFAEVFVTYNPGVLLNGVGAVCDHNEICNTPHMAIKYTGNDHLIEYNDIHDVVLHSTDAGAIYAGQDWAAYGTVIRYNKLVNIGAGEFMPDGIYWDDVISGQTAYRNLLINVRKHSFMVGGGRCNKVDENVIIDVFYNTNGELEGHPITYDDRAREGLLRDGWMKNAVINEGKGYWAHFDKWPIREGVWAEHYPNLAKVKTEFATTDPDDKDFAINPAYVSICGNIIVVPENPFYIWDSVYEYRTVENNTVYSSLDEAGWDSEKMCFTEDSPVFKDVPGFENIPVDKIGRNKK